jgi:hypothetical protein
MMQLMQLKIQKDKELGEKHLVLKKVRNFGSEYRCIIINGKLKAVITKSSFFQNLVDFINQTIYNFPICCCAEIGYTQEYKFEIIELNCIGPDMICDIYPYNWNEHLLELYGTDFFEWKKVY